MSFSKKESAPKLSDLCHNCDIARMDDCDRLLNAIAGCRHQAKHKRTVVTLKAKQDVTFNDVSQNQTKQKCTVVTLKAQKDVTLQDVSMDVAFDVDMSGSMRLKDVDGAYNRMSAIFEAVATKLSCATTPGIPGLR